MFVISFILKYLFFYVCVIILNFIDKSKIYSFIFGIDLCLDFLF